MASGVVWVLLEVVLVVVFGFPECFGGGDFGYDGGFELAGGVEGGFDARGSDEGVLCVV